MKSKAPVIIGVFAVVAIIASFGIGYALYNGNTYSENNTMAVSQETVDLLKDDGTGHYALLNEKITLPEYVAGSTVVISGYAVATTSNTGGVYVRCDMGSSAYWALIDSMEITVNETSIPFGKIVDQSDVLTGVPTDTPISMTNGTQVTISGKTLYYHAFTIEIEFADYDITGMKNYESLVSFAGSSFVFTYAPA